MLPCILPICYYMLLIGSFMLISTLMLFLLLIMIMLFSVLTPHSGELRTQKLKSHLVRTQSLNVLPLKPEVGMYIAIHATLTARISFLPISTLLAHSPAFFPNLSQLFLCWQWLTHGSCVGPQNKLGHPAWCRFPFWVPTEYKQGKNHDFVVWWLVKWITWR